MSSTRKLTDIPSCMRMSFNFPWESSPENEIAHPLSHDLPDIAFDFETIYGQEAAKDFFSSPPSTLTPTKGDNRPSALQKDSTHANHFIESFGTKLTPKSPSATGGSTTSPSSYVSDLNPLLFVPHSPGPTRRVSDGKRGQRVKKMGNTRARRQVDFRLSTSPQVPTSSDTVSTPELARSLQHSTLRIPTAGPSSPPGSHCPIFHPQQPLNSPAKLRPSSPSTQIVDANAPQRPEAFAHRYCRYPGCDERFSDKRATERHRLGHLPFGTYSCPNPACSTHTKRRPDFAREFTIGRHLKKAAPGSPCAEWKDEKPSSLRTNVAQAEALIRQALVPFDPAIHIPF